MRLSDFVTNNLAQDIIKALSCDVLNSEGKRQGHDWSDPYRRWTWYRGWIRRHWYRQCLRCGYVVRKIR